MARQSGRRGHLSIGRMALLPPGTQVVNGNSDIAVKRLDGLWQGADISPCTDSQLHKYGPIRIWSAVARPKEVRA